MDQDLTDKRVLVVGAGGCIGRATAALFAWAGASGARAEPHDFLDAAAVEAFFAPREPFDHVVVAAAATRSRSVSGLPLDDARAAMEGKFWGAYQVARGAKVVDGGSLTAVSGFLSGRPSAGAVLQGAINAALEELARGPAPERAPARVDAVSPGPIPAVGQADACPTGCAA